MLATIKDVAIKSGYSVGTVSAVINNGLTVSETARNRILKVIEELGYRPSTIARSMKGVNTKTIGILVRDITNPFYPALVFGMEEYCWSQGYQVFLCNTENNSVRESAYLDQLLSKQVDAIVISTPSYTERNNDYDTLKERNMKYIFLNRRPQVMYEDECFVGADNFKAGYLAVSHLIGLGHVEIGFVKGPFDYSTSTDRYNGFLKGMEECGMPVPSEWVVEGDNDEASGYFAVQRMLDSPRKPTAIFCSNDVMAFGAYRALTERRMKIPDGISLIGCDDNPYANLIGLSSVDLHSYEVGKIAGSTIIKIIEGVEVEKMNITGVSLVARQSVQRLTS